MDKKEKNTNLHDKTADELYNLILNLSPEQRQKLIKYIKVLLNEEKL